MARIEEGTASYEENFDATNCGEVLCSCDGQDITRRGAKKNKHHVLMIIPQHFAFSKSCDYEIGVLENANSFAPTFIVKTEGAILRYPGRFVSTSTAFFTLDCIPKSQSIIGEMYQFVLIFDKPTIEEVQSSNKPSTGSHSTLSSDMKEADTVEDTPKWVFQHGLSSNVVDKKVRYKKVSRNESGKNDLIDTDHENFRDSPSGDDGDVDSVSSIQSDYGSNKVVRRTASKRSAAVRAASQLIFREDSYSDSGFSSISDSDVEEEDDGDDYNEIPAKRRRR